MSKKPKYEERLSYLDFETELYNQELEAYKDELEGDVEEYLGHPSPEELLEESFKKLRRKLSGSSGYEEE